MFYGPSSRVLCSAHEFRSCSISVHPESKRSVGFETISITRNTQGRFGHTIVERVEMRPEDKLRAEMSTFRENGRQWRRRRRRVVSKLGSVNRYHKYAVETSRMGLAGMSAQLGVYFLSTRRPQHRGGTTVSKVP